MMIEIGALPNVEVLWLLDVHRVSLVVARSFDDWLIDPNLEDAKAGWILRVFDKLPLVRLSWDLGDIVLEGSICIRR